MAQDDMRCFLEAGDVTVQDKCEHSYFWVHTDQLPSQLIIYLLCRYCLDYKSKAVSRVQLSDGAPWTDKGGGQA